MSARPLAYRILVAMHAASCTTGHHLNDQLHGGEACNQTASTNVVPDVLHDIMPPQSDAGAIQEEKST